MTAIWEGFDRYLASRAPSDSHKAEVRRYRERIRDIIAKRHELMAFFQSGSFQHGTAVMPFSDVAYIARFWLADRPRSSTTILHSLARTKSHHDAPQAPLAMKSGPSSSRHREETGARRLQKRMTSPSETWTAKAAVTSEKPRAGGRRGNASATSELQRST